jgi:hypothetical protein
MTDDIAAPAVLAAHPPITVGTNRICRYLYSHLLPRGSCLQ